MAVKRIVLDRAAFFAALRKDNSGVFGRSLSTSQVEGTEAILDSAERNGVFNIDHISQILAHVYHETGAYMLGIKETVMPAHKEKRPSDSVVIARLNAAFAKGQLKWVSVPYWRDGAFGRGPIQITHWKNYDRMGTRLGVPLRQNPTLALDTKVGADIAVVGMSEGFFTGRKLSDYSFPGCLDEEPKNHPRRIVNGKDGTDQNISAYHRGFRAALVAGGFKVVEAAEIVTAPIQADTIVATPIVAGPVTTDKINAGSILPNIIPAVEVATPAGKWDWLIQLALKLFGGK